MARGIRSHTLAAAGTTGNQNEPTNAGVTVGDTWEVAAFEFVVEAVGATPTVSVQPQGSFDGTNWFAIPFSNENATTVNTTARALTATGRYLLAVDGQQAGRHFPRLRLAVTANTNVTYSGTLYVTDAD